MLARLVLWIGLGLSIAWFINTTQILDVIVLFLLAGAIPGTRILLPPLVMMVVLSLLLLLAAYWLKRQELAKQIRTMKAKHEAAVYQAPRKKQPKKTRTTPYLAQLVTVAMFAELHILPRLAGAYKKAAQNIVVAASHSKVLWQRMVKSIQNVIGGS